MATPTLHDRLDALGQKIAATEDRLRQQHHERHDAHHLTAQELKEQYRQLQARLDEEGASEEAHGHHVTNLERSVRQMIDKIGQA